jgi:hypothetical protein
VRDDDEEMPQPPTELPPGWKPGDMLPPEGGGGTAPGLLARAGMPAPDFSGGAGRDDGENDASNHDEAFSEDEGRAPAGGAVEEESNDTDNSEGDEAFPNGGGRRRIPGSVRGSYKGSEDTPENGATAVYGETSGVYPLKMSPHGTQFDPQNWEPNSRARLDEARQWLADLQRRNPVMQYDMPHGDNLRERMQMDEAENAQRNASSPREVGKVLMKQLGKGPQNPPQSWVKDGWVLHTSFGPFHNEKGGSVPAGDKTYIEFYKQLPINMRPRK